MSALDRVGAALDRELLTLGDQALDGDVTADLSALPAELQRRWQSVRQT